MAFDMLLPLPPPERIIAVNSDSWTMHPHLLTLVYEYVDFQLHTSLAEIDLRNTLDDDEYNALHNAVNADPPQCPNFKHERYWFVFASCQIARVAVKKRG